MRSPAPPTATASHSRQHPSETEPSAPRVGGRLRVGLVAGARVVLLAGPVALAFFAGGYFDEPRAWAGLIAWILVVVAVVAAPGQLPRSRAARVALIGLGLMAAWTLLSITWAPIAGNAYHAGQRLVLYVGGLLAATMLLRTRSAQRAVEPALVAGTLVVIGYGLSERLLPGLLHFARSFSAEGRLEQPLTYWNAMGEIAALGLVLAARVAGDASRAAGLRVAAAASTAPLGMGLYLTFSRGALFAAAAGLVTLIVAAPTRAQLRALLLAVPTAAAAAVISAPFGGVTSLAGVQATRERQGALVLVGLILLMSAAGAAQSQLTRRSPGRIGLPRRAPWIALGCVCVGLGLAIVAGAKEHAAQPLAPGATRLATLESNRYSYWRVALRAFRAEPLRGVGAGGWSVYWLRYRTFGEGAQDAHSLPLQTAAELGIVGVALLALFLGAMGVAAAGAHRLAPVLAAGPLAGFATYIAHAPLDWDWEMPAVTVLGLLLAGSLLALADNLDLGRPARQLR